MSKNLSSRRSVLLGAAGVTAAVPAAAILTPHDVIAANVTAGPGKAHHGPAHDWLATFVVQKMKEEQAGRAQ
jgi:hypothetical protein